MQINISENKSWYIKIISFINKFSEILFYIITNKIKYSFITKLYKIV